jgi:hypothetical protein
MKWLTITGVTRVPVGLDPQPDLIPRIKDEMSRRLQSDGASVRERDGGRLVIVGPHMMCWHLRFLRIFRRIRIDIKHEGMDIVVTWSLGPNLGCYVPLLYLGAFIVFCGPGYWLFPLAVIGYAIGFQRLRSEGVGLFERFLASVTSVH